MQNSLVHIKERVLTLLPKTDRKYLLAFSGGVDSVFMAHVLLQLDYTFEIAHVNYGLRGDESEENMQFCKQFANQH